MACRRMQFQLWKHSTDLCSQVVQLATVDVARFASDKDMSRLQDIVTGAHRHRNVEFYPPIHINRHNEDCQKREQRHQQVGF